MADYLVQEDGTSQLLLEDGTGALLLELQTTVVPSFIASNATLYAPTVAYTGTSPLSVTTAGTFKWLCPADVTEIYVECIGGGGPGGDGGTLAPDGGGGGGGGGAYAARRAVPVTPGTVYTFVVGGGGSGGGDGAASTFTGDSSVQVIAASGKHGQNGHDGGAGGSRGLASSSTGDVGLVFDGGDGGNHSGPGGGGGASGNRLANGAAGTAGSGTTGGTGGVGANGGGSGGNGADGIHDSAAGSTPGGGGGGGNVLTRLNGAAGADGAVTVTCDVAAPFIASTTIVYTPILPIDAPFIGSVTVVYTPSLPAQIAVPFIGSTTVVYTPSLPEVNVPFISSSTHVWDVFSLFDPNKLFAGGGNGGEAFTVRLAPNGSSVSTTLAAGLTTSSPNLSVTDDTGLPTSRAFVVTVDSEVIYIIRIGPNTFHIHGRGVSNTTTAAHSAGATVIWGDNYDVAILVTDPIAGSFTAAIDGSPSFVYPGWLVVFDSSQAYLAGDRYPTHVDQLLGVFAAGAGVGGTSKTDGAQPSAIATPNGTSDICPVGLTVPARIQTDINTGDVAVVRYTNPEAAELDLGPRSLAIQSWFGLKRVDLTDNDVTFTNPNGIVVDTTGGFGTYTASVEVDYPEPLPLAIGIAPDASDALGSEVPTPNPVPWVTTTLPGSDRYFTDGIHYNEKGWPFGVIAVRQGNRRVPFWQSWDWHNYSFVYDGFGTDCTFAQIVVNRNGIIFGSVPSVDLPGPQDIDGPDVVWDDPTYYFSAAWYVVIFNAPYFVAGPSIGGSGTISIGGGYTPVVDFPGGTGGAPGPPSVAVPPVEGGEGGDIGFGSVGLHVWQKSGGF